MDKFAESIKDYRDANKNCSLLNMVYQTGENIIDSQPGGVLGCYLISALKISKSFNPLAAAATFTIHSCMLSTLIKIASKINLMNYIFIFIPSLVYLGMAGFYLCVSTLTMKEQLAINVILFVSAIFAKKFGTKSENLEKATNNLTHAFENLPCTAALSFFTLEGQFTGLLSSCILSATKISKNISPLAATGSSAVYEFTKTLISQFPRKIAVCSKTINLGLIINVGSKPLAIIAAAGFYASVSILTFKGQLLVNAVILAGAMAGAIKETAK